VPDVQTSLPWSSDRSFTVWRYLDSHRQLLLRAYGEYGDEFLQIQFGDVVWMEIGQVFRGGITLNEVTEPGQRPVVTNYPFWDRFPLLLTELRSPKGDLGFVAAGFLQVRRMPWSSRLSPHGRSLELQLSVRRVRPEH